MYAFKFADIGEGLHEGKVTKILVKVGDVIKEGDSLFEVETDKVTSEITAPVHGKIIKINIEEEQTIHVGETVFVIDDGSGGELPAEPATESTLPTKPAPIVAPVPSNAPASANKNSDDLAISPLALKIAQEEKISLTNLQGSGPNGRIMTADLIPAANQPQVAGAAPVKSAPAVINLAGKREKTSPIRQAIAKNLKGSWDKVAYVSQVVEVDVTELVDLRSQYRDLIFKTTGVKLTYLPFVAKATALALEKHPIFTASYDEKTQELVYPGTLNLGFAVDTNFGLFVPNIKDAQARSVLELSKGISELAMKARDKKLSGAEMANGHFTISNYGSAGAIFGIPVIKFPEIAILGVGTIIQRLSGDNQVHHYMYLTLAADHRWVDGVAMVQFLNSIKMYLENPSLLAIF